METAVLIVAGLVHVVETDVLAGEDTADLESPTHAQALLEACIVELSEAGVPVTGELLRSYGTHTDVAAAIGRRSSARARLCLGPRHATRRRAASTRTSRPMHRAT
jgi:hypothetical protein